MKNLNVKEVLKMIEEKQYLEIDIFRNDANSESGRDVITIPVEESHKMNVIRRDNHNISFILTLNGKHKRTSIHISINSNIYKMEIEDEDPEISYVWFKTNGKDRILFTFEK